MSARNWASILECVGTLVGAAMLATAPPVSAVQYYTATPLGTLGGVYSYGRGINSRGEITGWAETSVSVNTARHAFLYTNGRMVDLGAYGSDCCSLGAGINNVGHITGGSDPSPEGIASRAYLYADGNMIDLGTLGCEPYFMFPSGGCARGAGINDRGQVTGTSGTIDGWPHAFLWSEGRMADLGTLGGRVSHGMGINGSGHVAGWSYIAGDAAEHAFLYANGRMTDLGTLGGTHSAGYAINDRGQVTGASGTAAPRATHAFLFMDGTMIDLGTLGGDLSAGYAINNIGQVTGASSTSADQRRAFLYTDGRMYDLNDLVMTGLDGARLEAGQGINDRGQIVADGCTASACQAYRLDPIATAIEYHHEVFDHYFVTASANEIGRLDEGAIPGWVRTGQSFRVFGMDPGAVNVCRFWSHQTFAPRSSHFYTPFDWECATVKRNADWLFEGEAFSMKLPDVAGNCVSGTMALYRVYNDGKSSAPNHRYTTSADIQQQMIALGWMPEGEGAGVIGCVPAP